MRSVAGLLLMLEGLQGFLCQTIHVSQIPVILTPEGSSVTLPCTYSISGAEDAIIGSYKWYRYMVRTGPEVTDSNKDFTGRISRVDGEEFISSRSASITLHRADVSDTGMYYCEVTFQHGGEISGHGAGTFLNVTSLNVTGSVSQKIHVYQIPAILTPEGSSVTLPCTYSISGAEDAIIGSYKWYRHTVRTGPEVTDSNMDFTSRISRPDREEFMSSRSASITLHRADVSDTGMYYCEVTFQHGGEISGHGAGTFLNVTESVSQTIHVSQIPAILTREGSSVTLPCTYTISGAEDAIIGSYKWYRHTVRTGPEVTDSNMDFTGRLSRVNADEFISSRSASITLHGANVSDTGIYYCEVTFQHCGEISRHGGGTFLNVTSLKVPALPDAGSRQVSYIVQNVVRLILAILVCALLCYFVLTAAVSPFRGIEDARSAADNDPPLTAAL